MSVPNSQILKTNIYNYSKAYNFIWNEIKILITFESNWRKAESILNEIAIKDFENNRDKIRDKLKQAQDQYILTYNYISPIIYVRIADSGVQLSIRYMVEVRKRRTSEDKLCRNILDSFAKESDIDFAYPTIRYYRKNEG